MKADNAIHSLYNFSLFSFFFNLFIFREKEREGGRQGEKYQCVVASHMAPTGDLAHNPGMGPYWYSNPQPFGLQPTLNPLSYTSQVGLFFFKLHFTDYYSCPNFPPFSPIHQAPPTPAGNPHIIVHVQGCKFFDYAISYTVLYIPWFFCIYLFVLLSPLTSSPFPPHPFPSGDENLLCIHDSVSVLVFV